MPDRVSLARARQIMEQLPPPEKAQCKCGAQTLTPPCSACRKRDHESNMAQRNAAPLRARHLLPSVVPLYDGPAVETAPETASKRLSVVRPERTCAWCVVNSLEGKRADAKYCSDECRRAAFTAEACEYCGAPSQARDHVEPRALRRALDDVRPARNFRLPDTVPVCHECNSLLGDMVFATVEAKRRYVKAALRRRYRKLLKSPNWTDGELAALGYVLRTQVVAAQSAKETLRRRLQWKEHPPLARVRSRL